ncbi:hypothetical protein LINPERPRIM_LOCUS28705 [Linum perenne]
MVSEKELPTRIWVGMVSEKASSTRFHILPILSISFLLPLLSLCIHSIHSLTTLYLHSLLSP